MKKFLIIFFLCLPFFACNLTASRVTSNPTPSPTIVVAKFNTSTPTVATATATQQHLDNPQTPTSMPTPAPTVTDTLPAPTDTPLPEETPTSPPSPTSTPASPANTPESELVVEKPDVDFVLRHVQLRTNEENSWDGVLGQCGSDHSIYVYVADAQENLLDGVLVGDKYGNFEVPTGVDGPGMVRILVFSAAMEVAVMGHQDGSRYTSDFTRPLSTVDEGIPLDWLQQAGYCESPEDCRQRVETNQLCRGHYSYDVIFQRTW